MFVGTIVLVLLLDQISKIMISLSMYQGESIPLLPPVLYLTCVHNYGVAFGLFANKAMLLAIIAVVLTVGVIVGYRNLPLERRIVRFGSALIIGGALGNLLDRVRLGYVVDFFDLRFWPVFNLADMAIVAGAALLIWDLLRSSKNNEDAA